MAETTVFSACPHDCPDTCAMLTTVRDGKAVAVRGNPDHPFTRGGLCVKVNDYENRVYSAHRVLTPLRRTGAKGAGEFQPITWDAGATGNFAAAGPRSSTATAPPPSCRTATSVRKES